MWEGLIKKQSTVYKMVFSELDLRFSQMLLFCSNVLYKKKCSHTKALSTCMRAFLKTHCFQPVVQKRMNNTDRNERGSRVWTNNGVELLLSLLSNIVLFFKSTILSIKSIFTLSTFLSCPDMRHEACGSLRGEKKI